MEEVQNSAYAKFQNQLENDIKKLLDELGTLTEKIGH